MFLSSGDGYLGKILEFPKRVKNPLEFQEGTWAFYEIAAVFPKKANVQSWNWKG